jgi:hypothetical protein
MRLVRLTVAIALVGLMAGCSSGPSSAQLMAAWDKGQGGQDMARVHKYLAEIIPLEESGQITALAGDGIFLVASSIGAQDSPPPVDASQYKQAIADIQQAGKDLSGLTSQTRASPPRMRT